MILRAGEVISNVVIDTMLLDGRERVHITILDDEMATVKCATWAVPSPAPEGAALVPVGAILAEPGVYTQEVRLEGGGPTEYLDDERIVVESRRSKWLTCEWMRERWDDAPTDDAELWELLNVARYEVEAFAPPSVPASVLRSAQRTQAVNIWNASQASPSGDGDGGGFGLTPLPLDWTVKQMLRPRAPGSGFGV